MNGGYRPTYTWRIKQPDPTGEWLNDGKIGQCSMATWSGGRTISGIHHDLVGGFNLPLWKMMELVSWDHYSQYMAVGQNLVPLVNIKIAGKWMFIPLKMVLIGIDS